MEKSCKSPYIFVGSAVSEIFQSIIINYGKFFFFVIAHVIGLLQHRPLLAEKKYGTWVKNRNQLIQREGSNRQQQQQNRSYLRGCWSYRTYSSNSMEFLTENTWNLWKIRKSFTVLILATYVTWQWKPGITFPLAVPTPNYMSQNIKSSQVKSSQWCWQMQGVSEPRCPYRSENFSTNFQ